MYIYFHFLVVDTDARGVLRELDFCLHSNSKDFDRTVNFFIETKRNSVQKSKGNCQYHHINPSRNVTVLCVKIFLYYMPNGIPLDS